MKSLSSPPVLSERLQSGLAALLTRLNVHQFRTTLLYGGGNNQVYRLDTPAAPLLLKVYFQHPGDTRNRLTAEHQFASFAWTCGIRCAPRPLAVEESLRIGLYEYIAGRIPTPKEVTGKRVDTAAAFFLQLNEHRRTPDARRLPPASEACFSIADHIRCVDRRVRRLCRISSSRPIDRLGMNFARGPLSQAWRNLRGSIVSSTTYREMHRVLPRSQRRISPSDFGFHNAILAPDGRMRFIDFEYAGWDDPAKTVCDFFCQKKVPVPMRYFARFCDAVLSGCQDPVRVKRRTRALLPAYRLKWCCILMNEFLPAGRARRAFAIPHFNPDERKAAQLEHAFQSLSDLYSDLPS